MSDPDPAIGLSPSESERTGEGLGESLEESEDGPACLVLGGDWSGLTPDAHTLTRLAVQAARDQIDQPSDAPCAVVFSDDAQVRALNAAHRDKDAPTNVLSFPADPSIVGAEPELGDIVLAYETISREAVEAGLSLAARTAHMIVHGYLHLEGFDHIEHVDAEAMEAIERAALAALGYPDPYPPDSGFADPSPKDAPDA